MFEYKLGSQYRTRTVRSLTATTPPIVSKYFIDVKVEHARTPRGRTKLKECNSSKLCDTTLELIIRKLKKNNKSQDILLMITPASKHPNLYKLHVIHSRLQEHLGMISIKEKELTKLRSSKAFHKYCIVLASQYMDLKTVVLKLDSMLNLVNTPNKKCSSGMKSKEAKLKSYMSSAEDCFDEQLKSLVRYRNSVTQTNAEEVEYFSYTLNDLLILIETINNSVDTSEDLDRFFAIADKLKLSLIIRPDMFWKPLTVFNQVPQNVFNLYVECYIPDNSYIGSVPLTNVDLLDKLELYPNLIADIQVINDVYELTPLPMKLVEVLQKLFNFLKLELLYDAIGELLFDWFKNITFVERNLYF